MLVNMISRAYIYIYIYIYMYIYIHTHTRPFELVQFLHELAIHYLLLADTYQTIDQNIFSLLYSLSCSKSTAQSHIICFIIKNPLVSRGVHIVASYYN